jgi:hypothetical protein
MKNLMKKTPAQRELFVQAYVKEGEWDATPFHTEHVTRNGQPCLAKYYGCHYDPDIEECNPGDEKVHYEC